MGLGMPLPRHPFDLFVAFTFVAFAFIGLGLVIAMLADNVPAVQALGQCIFLPMLIIGGVAVPLASLPDWAQHLSAFFPGPLRGRGAAGVRHRQRAGRRRLQPARARAHRRGRLRRGREDVPLGRAAALRRVHRARAGSRSRSPRGWPSASRAKRRVDKWLAPCPRRCQPPFPRQRRPRSAASLVLPQRSFTYARAEPDSNAFPDATGPGGSPPPAAVAKAPATVDTPARATQRHPRLRAPRRARTLRRRGRK